MNLLLFTVSSIFSFIFYAFYTKTIGKDIFLHDIAAPTQFESLTGNLFFEAFLFLVIGVTLYLSFSSFDVIKDKTEGQKIGLKELSGFIGNFFKKYLYYIGFFLFYFSIYLILHQLGVNFSYFVFIISFVIFCLFFLANQFYLFRDFIKVNTILFSLVYIAYYIYSFFVGKVIFIEIDFINSFLILIFFVLTIYSDNFLLKKPFSDTALTLYFFVYLFLFISFYLYVIFGNLTLTFAILGFLFSLFCYYAVPELELFKNSIIPLRYFSLLFSYIGIAFSLLYFKSNGVSLMLLIVLIISSYFNFLVHRKFSNYISLVFCFLSFGVFANASYFTYISPIFDSPQLLLGYTFILSLIAIFTPLLYNSQEIIEHYFFHTYSYILNIIGVIYFFVFNGFDIFTFGVILLIESLFVFFSYYKINFLKAK